MAGWDGEIFLHATTCMSMVSYFFKTLFKSHKWPKWISSQHYPYVVSRENLTRINKIITNGKISKGILQKMPNANAEWLLKFINRLGLGNWVNQVTGQFSQDNDSKWSLIHAVS